MSAKVTSKLTIIDEDGDRLEVHPPGGEYDLVEIRSIRSWEDPNETSPVYLTADDAESLRTFLETHCGVAAR